MNWTPDQLRSYMTRRLASEQLARERMQPISEVQFQEKVLNENNTVGALSNPKRKHDLPQALVSGNKRVEGSGARLDFRVSIISVRKRLLDGDNLIAGSKWLRDHIAKTLERDDAEGAGLEFEYSQVLTKGEEGTIVRLESLNPAPKAAVLVPGKAPGAILMRKPPNDTGK